MNLENKRNKSNQTQYIFFLKLGKSLPDHFFYLAEMFLLYDYTLIPVELNALKDLMSPNKQFVISLTTGVAGRKQLRKVRTQYLDHAILRNLINFYDLTSFSSFSIRNLPMRRLNYYYIKLPVALFDIVSLISETLERDVESQKTWPGGRRPQLPKLVQNQ